MSPTASLCLPGTVQDNMHPAQSNQTPGNPDSERRPESRLSSRVSLLERSSLDKVFFPKKSSDDVSRSNSFNSISTALSFADFVTGLHDAPSEIRSLVIIIQRVQEDIERALRLRGGQAVLNYCAECLSEKSWIDNALADAQKALDDIGKYVENVRISGSSDDGGALKMRSKFDWVLRHHRKVRDRQTTLLFCHQSLSTVINLMQMVEMGAMLESQSGVLMPKSVGLPTRPSTRYGEAPKRLSTGPSIQQEIVPGNWNFSTPSITVSEMSEVQLRAKLADSEGEMIKVDPVNADPIELPGSAPQTISDTDHVDLHSMPPRPAFTITKSASLPDVSEGKPSLHTVPTRDDSIRPVSVTPPAEFPLLAKRCQAQPVQIPGPRGRRHRSLTTTLPYIPQTPSLVTEFAHLLSNRVDAVRHGRAPDLADTLRETKSTPQNPPHTSSVSYLVYGQNSRMETPNPPVNTASQPASLPSIQQSSQRTAQSSIMRTLPIIPPKLPRKEVPAPAIKTERTVDHPTPTRPRFEDTRKPASGLQPKAETENPRSNPGQSAPDGSHGTISLTDGKSKDAREEGETSSGPGTPPTASVDPTAVEPAGEQTQQVPKATLKPIQHTANATSTQTTQVHKLHTSSQARRRKAHQRRMQAAYGREEDGRL